MIFKNVLPATAWSALVLDHATERPLLHPLVGFGVVERKDARATNREDSVVALVLTRRDHILIDARNLAGFVGLVGPGDDYRSVYRAEIEAALAALRTSKKGEEPRGRFADPPRGLFAERAP